MKIKFVKYNYLRNDEHFQFYTEVKELIARFNPATLNIEALYDTFVLRYNDEDEALKKIIKSATTAEIEAADHQRDHTFRGLVDANKSALNHYDPDVAEAAKRLDIVFHTYGNIARKPLNEETSAIYNLCQDLSGSKYGADTDKVGLTGWVEKLSADNNAFEALVRERNSEQAAITQLKMKECRAETDRVYSEITERINALIVVEGATAYADFVNELNVFIDKYNNTIAQRTAKK